jgi:hypothetical protein
MTVGEPDVAVGFQQMGELGLRAPLQRVPNLYAQTFDSQP